MSSLKKDIKENKLLVAIVSIQDYNNKIIEITKATSNNKNLCYVSLNKPYNTINDNFKSKKINTNKFIFIDAITKSSKTKEANVIFISSLKALTELNISIYKILEGGKVRNMIFDSLSTLLIYEKPATVSKFVHSLTAKLRALNVNTVFIILKEDVTKDLLKNFSMFVDKVVDLAKNR